MEDDDDVIDDKVLFPGVVVMVDDEVVEEGSLSGSLRLTSPIEDQIAVLDQFVKLIYGDGEAIGEDGS